MLVSLSHCGDHYLQKQISTKAAFNVHLDEIKLMQGAFVIARNFFSRTRIWLYVIIKANLQVLKHYTPQQTPAYYRTFSKQILSRTHFTILPFLLEAKVWNLGDGQSCPWCDLVVFFPAHCDVLAYRPKRKQIEIGYSGKQTRKQSLLSRPIRTCISHKIFKPRKPTWAKFHDSVTRGNRGKSLRIWTIWQILKLKLGCSDSWQ